MLNLEDKTALNVLGADTYKNFIRTYSEKTIDQLNLDGPVWYVIDREKYMFNIRSN